MAAVVLAAMAGVIVMGYLIMGRIDAFLKKEGFKEPVGIEPEVLIYAGDRSFGGFYEQLDQEGIAWEMLDSPQVLKPARLVAAFSWDDGDNLTTR